MKTLVIYYNYSGKTKLLAEQTAAAESAELCPVQDVQRPGLVKAYTAGCLAAKKQESWPVQELPVKLGEYQRFIVLAPIWFGFPAPQINTVLRELPPGGEVELVTTADSGKSAAEEKVRTLVEAQSCKVTSYRVVKSSDIKE